MKPINKNPFWMYLLVGSFIIISFQYWSITIYHINFWANLIEAGGDPMLALEI